MPEGCGGSPGREQIWLELGPHGADVHRVFWDHSGPQPGPSQGAGVLPPGDMKFVRGCEPLGVTHTTSSHNIEARRESAQSQEEEPLPSAVSVQNLLVTKLAKEKCLEGPAPVSQNQAEKPGPAAEKRTHGNLLHVLS